VEEDGPANFDIGEVAAAHPEFDAARGFVKAGGQFLFGDEFGVVRRGGRFDDHAAISFGTGPDQRCRRLVGECKVDEGFTAAAEGNGICRSAEASSRV
jgi:hypothetical protein